MRIKIKNLPVLTTFKVSDKYPIVESLYATGCPLYDTRNLLEEIFSTAGNMLERIRVDVSTYIDTYTGLMKFSDLSGFKEDGTEQTLPSLIGTCKISQWMTTEERDTAQSSFTDLSVTSEHIVDANLSQGWIHFKETDPPTIDSAVFSLTDYNNIFVGLGVSPYMDNITCAKYLSHSYWQAFHDKISSWYNYTTVLPNGYFKLSYVQSDMNNCINTGLNFTNNTKIIADIAFTLQSPDGYSVFGSVQSGMKGTTSGLIFAFSNHTHTIQDGSTWCNDTIKEYEIDIPDNIIKLDASTLYSGTGGTSLGGTITLFGDASANYIGRCTMLKIFEGNNLVSHLVPAGRNSDYCAGLYDTVRNQFFGFSTYTSPDITRALSTHNNDNITTETGDKILI